jgi:hypothetical protein
LFLHSRRGALPHGRASGTLLSAGPSFTSPRNVPGMKKFPVVMEAMTKLPDYYVHVACPVKSSIWLSQKRDRLMIIGVSTGSGSDRVTVLAISTVAWVETRSLPPPHAGCPRGGPGPLPVLTPSSSSIPCVIARHRWSNQHVCDNSQIETLPAKRNTRARSGAAHP